MLKIHVVQIKNCMGCNLLHYAYPAQLKHKKDLIKESLKKYTELDRSQIKIDQIIGMNQKRFPYTSQFTYCRF